VGDGGGGRGINILLRGGEGSRRELSSWLIYSCPLGDGRFIWPL
jgi:hypothetical protein